MNKSIGPALLTLVLGWFLVTSSVAHAADQTQPLLLFDFGRNFDVASVLTNDAAVSLSDGGALRVETGHEKTWPGITLKAPSGKWDLSEYRCISLDVKNLGSGSLTVNCRVDNPGADGLKDCVTESIMVKAKTVETLVVPIFPSPWRLSEPTELIGMRGAPVHSGKVDASRINQIIVFINKPGTGHLFEIDNIRAGGHVETLEAGTFFPFIDQFGQFIHREWPGKTHSVQEMVSAGKAELQDLGSHAGPPDRDKYGGWTVGPKLAATGFFRVEKYRDKWWLVDPEGRLFWSHGIDCVGAANATPITDREHYYRNLPQSTSPLARFYDTGSWAPHGYYSDHSPYKTYDFSKANFLRKYGRNWEQAFAEITHLRLKSWGLNTIGNWSDSRIYLMRKTPYVATIGNESRRLEGSQGYWGKFYDVFDPGFAKSLAERLAAQRQTTANDPWCIGYFVHNELSWGDEVSLAVAALASPAEQPAKKVFIEDLRAKYTTIGSLNAAWDTKHPSWDALVQSRQPPDRKKAWGDLTAFYTKTAETYFNTVRQEVKKAAPLKLYLGCRFAWVNDRAALAAVKFCDVVSYNRYTYSVRDQRLPDNIDKPIIIGEFHFGALDRGMFHTGLRRTADQQDRADKYRGYVLGALRNPYIVGTHWFQYKDQATTGRGDGENYQIGFIDVCDRPYPEIVGASREVGYGMYEYRLAGK
jgi:hypothetical protein